MGRDVLTTCPRRAAPSQAADRFCHGCGLERSAVSTAVEQVFAEPTTRDLGTTGRRHAAAPPRPDDYQDTVALRGPPPRAVPSGPGSRPPWPGPPPHGPGPAPLVFPQVGAGSRAPLPRGGPPGWRPPHAGQAPPPQRSPRGQGRTVVLVAVAVAAVAALVLGGVLLASPAALVAAQPCEAAAGSSLPGFEGVVGPNQIGGLGSLVQTSTPGGQACTYITAGASPETVEQVGGHVVLLVWTPRAAVDADPELGAAFRTSASGTPSSSSSSYPVSLVRSGVTVTATPSGSGASALAATCTVGTDYWSVSVASYAQRDDAGAVDALLVAMGCGPVAGAS